MQKLYNIINITITIIAATNAQFYLNKIFKKMRLIFFYII